VNLLEVDNSTPPTFAARLQQQQDRLWQDLDHRYFSGIRVMRELARFQRVGPTAIMPVVFTSLLNLGEQADGLTIFSELESAIGEAIADDGSITDDASPELAKIRRERRAADARLREHLDRVLRTPAVLRMLREPLVTIRGERYVLPVRSEFRDQFPGVLHDQSASGVTVFMEPLAIVPLGNHVRELASAEQIEIARILAALSASVGAAAGPIGETLETLGTPRSASAWRPRRRVSTPPATSTFAPRATPCLRVPSSRSICA
jgi:hypothetical protein